MSRNPRICYITAGAANMYCGSCMRDNALAAALHKLDCDVKLIPTYTPVHTDEEDVSEDRVMLGGLNLYLQQKYAVFRKMPAILDRWLNHSRLIKTLAESNLETTGHETGAIAVSLLKGENGNQRKEFLSLIDLLAREFKPELVNLTNILIAGCAPLIKSHLNMPVLVTLQGDDLFLEQIPEPYKSRAFEQIQKLTESIDGFIAFNEYYADFMAQYLNIPRKRIHIVQMGIHLDDFKMANDHPQPGKPIIGYFARICPEKGFHLLVDAFIQLREMPGMDQVRLKAAGWLAKNRQRFLDEQICKLDRAGLEADFEYVGALDRPAKIEFLRSLTLFSVPSVYQEPKGLYILEALAAGVPVVQPNHGGFPELINATGGGCLVPPGSAVALATAWYDLLKDSSTRARFGKQGQQRVFESFNAETMAKQTLQVYRQYLLKPSSLDLLQLC